MLRNTHLSRAAALALLIALAITASAQVAIDGSSTVLGTCTVDLRYTTYAACTVYTVPAGQRLVVDLATVHCGLSSTSALVAPADITDARLVRGWNDSPTVGFPVTVPVRKQAAGTSNLTPDAMWSGAVNGPFSADDKLNFQVSRFAGSLNNGVCRVAIDGKLIPKPPQ
jgi:hypothetical protein